MPTPQKDGGLGGSLRLDQAIVRFGERVKESRTALGMSQEVAAERAGISQSNWSKVERGAIDPSLRQVLQIQMALSAPSVESFFGAFPSQAVASGSEESG